MNIFVIVLFIALFQIIAGLKISFNANNLRLDFEPDVMKKLMESLLKHQYFDILAVLLEADGSDMASIYCDLWKSANNFDLISKIWDDFSSGKIEKKLFNSIMLPECIAKSSFAIINLTGEVLKSLPYSPLQVKNFPVQLLIGDTFEVILSEAVNNRPHNPKIRWSDWILGTEFDFVSCFSSPFYYKFGWQFVDSNNFFSLSETKRECMFRWILDKNEEEFLKLSDEEVFLRTLTIVSLECFVNTPTLVAFRERMLKRFIGTHLMALCLKILNLVNDWSLTFLFEIMSIIETIDPKLIIGDWFIGILSLWRRPLKEIIHEEIVEKLLSFIFSKLNPTIQGVLKLTGVFDASYKPFIETKVIENFIDIAPFYRECPTYFDNTFHLIPLRTRWILLLKMRRTFFFNLGKFLLDSEIDSKPLDMDQCKNFLIILSETFRDGIEYLPQHSLNPSLLYFGNQPVSFKNGIKLFFQAITMKHLVKTTEDGSLILMPICPQSLWEFLGYFLIQAKILNVQVPFKLHREFFLQAMNPQSSSDYVKTLSEPFKKCKADLVPLFSHNLKNRFSIRSILSTGSFPLNEVTDCQDIVEQLYLKGMISLQKGMNYVMNPVKFLPDEIYSIIFPQ